MPDFIFNPTKLTKKVLKNRQILCVNNHFFLYKNGVFFQTSIIEIYRIINEILGEEYRERRAKEIVHCLMNDTFKRPEEINADKNLINLKNGMFTLSNFDLLEHDPIHFSTIQLPIIFDPFATCSLWLKTLDEIFIGSSWKIDTLQEFLGYCLTADNTHQKALLNVGSGANGKSLIFKVASTILGRQNISSIPLSQLDDTHYLAELFGKLVNISLEGETNEEINDANFKAVVAGDLITADEKYGKPFNFNPFCKLIFSTNTLPFVNDKTEAFYRRILVLPYERVFKTEEQDRGLAEKLIQEESSGIFFWMIMGLKRLRSRGYFETNGEMKTIIDDYRKDNNPTLSFVEENLVFNMDQDLSKGDVYRKYFNWCKDNGYKPSSDKNLGKTIKKFFNNTVLDGRTGEYRFWKNLEWKKYPAPTEPSEQMWEKT